MPEATASTRLVVPFEQVGLTGIAEVGGKNASLGEMIRSQLTLGLDRDSALVADLFDERHPAVKTLIEMVIETAHRCGRKIGICGQAPSAYPEFARFLVGLGIDSISLNPDALVSTRLRIAEIEKELVQQAASPPMV